MNVPPLEIWRLYQALYQSYIRKLPQEKIQQLLKQKEGETA